MKRRTKIILFVSVLLVVLVLPLFLFGCKDETVNPGEANTQRRPPRSTHLDDPGCLLKYDDTVSLVEALTQSYDLADLHSFFLPHQFYTSASLGDEPDILRYSEVNEVFPVEVTRSFGYSVYRVTEGGYYYVFWNFSLDEEANKADDQDKEQEPGEFDVIEWIDWENAIMNPDPLVYYSTYIPRKRNASLLSFGMKTNFLTYTGEDFRKIDPYCEFWLYPTGNVHHRWSFSYWGNNQLLRVTYKHIPPDYKGIVLPRDWDYFDLKVVKVEFIDIADTPSMFAEIFKSDFPN